MVGHRSEVNEENTMVFKTLRVSFDTTGVLKASEFLPTLIDSGKAEFGVALTGATTVNVNTDIDEGYSIELKIDLTGLGYNADLGDKLFLQELCYQMVIHLKIHFQIMEPDPGGLERMAADLLQPGEF